MKGTGCAGSKSSMLSRQTLFSSLDGDSDVCTVVPHLRALLAVPAPLDNILAWCESGRHDHIVHDLKGRKRGKEGERERVRGE